MRPQCHRHTLLSNARNSSEVQANHVGLGRSHPRCWDRILLHGLSQHHGREGRDDPHRPQEVAFKAFKSQSSQKEVADDKLSTVDELQVLQLSKRPSEPFPERLAGRHSWNSLFPSPARHFLFAIIVITIVIITIMFIFKFQF